MGASICNAVAEREISGEWSEEEPADDRDRHLLVWSELLIEFKIIILEALTYLPSPVKRSREMLADLLDSGVFWTN